MKKNITINLFGTLYAIDEDAYELLSRYLSDMKEYFSTKEGGEEIADDIEHRAAELMQELKSEGVEAVTIEHVKSIIKRIGSPEEMEEEVSGSNAQDSGQKGTNWFSQNFGQKKMYRNVNDKMFGGVISGLACYIGIDVTWLRLLTVLLAFLSFGTVTLVYLILWIIIPAAVTPEDRLHMQGRSINMDNLRDEIINGAKRTGEFMTAPKTKSTAHGCLNGILNVLVVLVKGFFTLLLVGFVVICGVALVGLLVSFVLVFFFMIEGTFANVNGYVHADDVFLFNLLAYNKIYWIGAISLFASLILIIYFCVHFILRQSGRAKPMGASLIVYIIGLLISIAVFISSLVGGTTFYYRTHSDFEQQQSRHRDSIFVQQQLHWLSNAGWEVVEHKNCGNRYLNKGKHYTGNSHVQYIDVYSENPNMEYTVERTVNVTPGIYRLDAVARTDGNGPEIYAYSGTVRYFAPIPNTGDYGGDIWQQAVDKYAKNKSDNELKKMAKVHSGKGFGWSYVTIDNIEVKDSVLRYGVSNRSSTGEWDGKWFSITDFKLKKIK